MNELLFLIRKTISDKKMNIYDAFNLLDENKDGFVT
jgi:hypothetical protein